MTTHQIAEMVRQEIRCKCGILANYRQTNDAFYNGVQASYKIFVRDLALILRMLRKQERNNP